MHAIDNVQQRLALRRLVNLSLNFVWQHLLFNVYVTKLFLVIEWRLMLQISKCGN